MVDDSHGWEYGELHSFEGMASFLGNLNRRL